MTWNDWKVSCTGGRSSFGNASRPTISVPAGTPAATYDVTYQLCDALNPGNCTTAVAKVTVAAPSIAATADTYASPAVDGFAGGSAGSYAANSSRA